MEEVRNYEAYKLILGTTRQHAAGYTTHHNLCALVLVLLTLSLSSGKCLEFMQRCDRECTVLALPRFVLWFRGLYCCMLRLVAMGTNFQPLGFHGALFSAGVHRLESTVQSDSRPHARW